MGQNLQRIAKESAFRRVKANAFHREEVPTRGFERFRTPSYPQEPCLLQERTGGAMAWGGPMRGSMSHRPDPRDGSRQTSLVGRLLGRPSARAARTLPSSGPPLPSLWSSSAARSSRLCRPSASARPHPPQSTTTGRCRPRPPARPKQPGPCRAPHDARPCPAARAGGRDPPPVRDAAR